jgi:spore germination protein YaaH
MNTYKKVGLIAFGILIFLFVGLFAISLILKSGDVSEENLGQNIGESTDNGYNGYNGANFAEISSSGFPVTSIPTDIPNRRLEYSGWIPNWASSSGLESLTKNNALFNSVSPVWYEVNEDGSLKKTYPANRAQIIEFAKANGKKIYPTIAMFDHELFTKVLQNEENLSRHINSILEEAKAYDGIDLDYESTKLSDRDKYFEFISSLSDGLKNINKSLIITVMAKWGDNVLYPSLPETRQVQDWEVLSKYADEIRIMAYDFTFSKSYFPGPIAPLLWVRDCLSYAITKIPASKIVLGIHLYSYEWSTDATIPYDFIVDMSANKTGDKAAASYNYTQVKSIISEHKGELSEFDNESIFRYEYGGQKKTLVYQTPLQLSKRIELAKEFNIKGVVFWRLGGDDDLLSLLTF